MARSLVSDLVKLVTDNWCSPVDCRNHAASQGCEALADRRSQGWSVFSGPKL